MDKITLNKEQLQRLVRFIYSRGFKDPLVVMDILDHFSCKVEEELTIQPGLSLENAMQQAHYSFGIKSFLPLAESSKGALVKKSMAIYKAVKYDVLTSPLQLLVIFALSLSFYYGYHWAAMTNRMVPFMDSNLFTFIGYLLLLVSSIFLGIRFANYKGLQQIVNEACLNEDKWILVFMVLIAFVIPQIPVFTSANVLSLLRTMVYSLMY